MKKLILLLLFGFSLSIYGQKSGIISGKVVESESNFSLPGATLKILGNNKYATTNQVGEFQFLDVKEGVYEVEVTYIGYQKQTQNVTVTAGKNSSLLFSIKPGTEELEEVILIGDRLRGQAKAINKQKSNQNITNVISSDQVGRFPDANIGDALKRVQGITM